MPHLSSDDSYSENETIARRDATIKRMIAMPPKPHSKMKIGKKAKKKMPKKKRVGTNPSYEG
jgi:hypothetical protein